MRKLKVQEWIQLVLMFFVAFWAMVFLAERISPGAYSSDLSTDFECYMPLYSNYGHRPYIAALCADNTIPLSIIRIHQTRPKLVTVNAPLDVVTIAALFIAGIISWLVFIYRVVTRYVPGI